MDDIFGPIHYLVQRIDGDYAWLVRPDSPDGEPLLVARALLPDGIDEGVRLLWQDLQYTIE